MPWNFATSVLKEILINKPKTVAEEIATAGMVAYCKLYREHPFWAFARIGKNFGPISRAVSEVCNLTNYPPPNPPVSAFSGGQCQTLYRVLFSCKAELWRYTNLGGNVFEGYVFPSLNSEASTIINGPIKVVTPIFTGPCPSQDPDQINCTWGTRDLSVRIVCENIPEGINLSTVFYTSGPFQGSALTLGSRNYIRFDSLTEKSILIERIDGLPDNCGNVPPTFTPEPPPTETDGKEEITINNFYNEDIDYNVEINKDKDGFFSFPPVIFVDGVTIEFDLGGVTFNINNNKDKPSGKPGLDLPDYIEPISISEPPLEEKEDLDSDSYQLLPTSISGTDSNLVAIVVQFDSIPSNAKLSDGNQAPRIIYGGWIEFQWQNNNFPRVFLDFDNNIFLPPEGAKSWAITIKRGYNANIFKLVKVTENGD